ncbi:transposase [Ensifer sp. P24N7]|uniref:IS66-like element accessory protein TnpA n=1 Tax=Sinorhizobium sp. P24N7 TaxID=3348358 RepID=UPI0035F48D20
MTKQLVEVITSVERRRHWPREEKERLVAATFEPTASVSEIAHSAGIHVSQLFRWRKELCQVSAPSIPQLVPVEIAAALPAPASLERPVARSRKKASMEAIELGGGRRLRVESDVDTEALAPSSMFWSGDGKLTSAHNLRYRYPTANPYARRGLLAAYDSTRLGENDQ